MSARLSRRQLLQAGTVAAAGLALSVEETSAMSEDNTPRSTGLCLNEDNSHFFITRADRKLDAVAVDAFVDQYAGTQVRELILCPNAMRTSYGSGVWDPIWRGYDPNGTDDQLLFASLKPEARKVARKWVHTAWQLHRDGIDPYKRWIDRARYHGISPWISMRMNDVHNVDDERCYMHSEFWRQNPGLRRVQYRFVQWTDRAFDYGRPEVREHHLKLIRELAGRYDFDGLELDWMRFGFHFRPGYESEGAGYLTQFTAEVRSLLNDWEKRRGHKIRLGARVPSRPQTALGLGMDAVTWARYGLIDMLVVTPFWATVEPDMPIEIWKQLLHGTKVMLAAGLEVLIHPYPDYSHRPTNSLETTRGAAATLLDRGADRIYLFNYMDSDTAISDIDNYGTLLRECGSLETLRGKYRRHVLTYSDTWAPGEASAYPLPANCSPGNWQAFRIPIGPRPTLGRIEARLGIEGVTREQMQSWQVRVNGDLCPLSGPPKLEPPRPEAPVFAFNVPLQTIKQGYNLIEILPKSQGKIVWVEVAADIPQRST